MAKRMGRRPAATRESSRLHRLGEGVAQDMGGDGTGSPAVGKQPSPVTVILGLPHPPQALVDLLGHGHNPFLIALADDTQNATGLVDRGDGKCGGLADPQAAAIDQAETTAVNGVADSVENAPNLGMGKGLWQALLLGEPDLFLNSAQS